MTQNKARPVNVIFMGSPEFAVPSLENLLSDASFDVKCVFTMPDRPRGRGQKETMTPVKQLALKAGIPIHAPQSFRKEPGLVELIEGYAPNLLVVVAYGHILPAPILEIPTMGAINLHASLLPRHRGPSPIHFALLSGDAVTGNTVMLMNSRMDEGDVLAVDSLAIASEDTYLTLHDRLARSGAVLLNNTLKSYIKGDLSSVPQDHSKATYTTKITPDLARINWTKSAPELLQTIRAFSPAPGAWFEFKNERFKIGNARLGPQFAEAPGKIIFSDPKIGLRIKCGENTTIDILSLQRPGKSLLPISDFLRGFRFDQDLV